MKSTFTRKPATLEEARRELANITAQDDYKVTATKKLSTAEWDSLTTGLQTGREWLAAFSKKAATKAAPGKRNCIKVTCAGKTESLLIDTQGYDYARYIAILEA